MTTVAVIVAGGAGLRADPGTGGVPKQFLRLGGRTVVSRAVAPFLAHPRLDAVQVVIREGWEEIYAASVASHPRLLPPVVGGERRQDSVRAGLEAVARLAPAVALIHDAARPFVSAGVIDRVLGALPAHAGAIPVVPVSDTIKRLGPGGTVVGGTVDRADLRAAQTPQGFRFADIREAHMRAAASGREFTDDAAVAEWAGLAVAVVPGDPANRKLTTAEDFIMAAAALGTAERPRMAECAAEYRTGSGFDVHRFGPGDHVALCGIRIAHTQGLIGHSDADVGLHALTDAVLGAIADGDIGSHFPPSDPQWRGAESAIFLRHACRLLGNRGGRLVHADVTIICEAPRIGPHRDAMRERIAEILGIGIGRVSVKATTSEQLGFAGRREGIAAQAAVTVALPEERDR